uniref:zona pellucida sperm-binding protein 3-like n=1 Tax=Pristiophorus japonicus TaxID=55135 RepID=UPI00398F76C9
MWCLVSVLLLVGAVCSNNREHSKYRKLLQSRFRATHVPGRIAGGWNPASVPGTAASPSSSFPQTLTALCGEQSLLVTASLDLLGTGHLIQAADLTLGPLGCPFTQLDARTNTVLFHHQLSECGIAVVVTAHQLIYSTHLYYTPRPTRSVIVRSSSAIALIECRYPREIRVNRQAVWPPWVPSSSLQTGGTLVSYSLRRMNDDWGAERTSNVYHLGDSINVEASVITTDHVPLRLYVDSCVATLTPDKDSTPRYHLIDSNGCLMDSRAEDSSSSFVSPRVHQDKLQIKLDAFRFVDVRSSIFISCRLTVAVAVGRPDPVNKACFFRKPANEWVPVEGSSEICLCCDQGTCGGGRRGWSIDLGPRATVSQFEDDQLRKVGEVQMGPLLILAALPGDVAPRVRIESQNVSDGQKAPEHSVDMKAMLIVVGVVGAVALVLSGLVVGGAVLCGALTIFNLYNKLAKSSI